MAEIIKYSPQEAGRQVLPTIRAVDLVDRAWDPQREKLGLQRAPIEIQVIDMPGQPTEYVAAVGSHLRKSDFFDFLKLVAPNKLPVSIGGVLDDWDLPDRTDFRKDPELTQRHQALGEAWDIFEQSRKIFMQNLIFDWESLYQISRNYWTEEMAEAKLRGFLIYPQGKSNLYSLFRSEPYSIFLNPIQEPKMGRKKKMEDIRGNLTRYSSLKGKKREEMVDEYLGSLTEEERKSMLAAYVRADSKFLLRGNSLTKYGPFEIKEENDRVEIRSGDFQASAVIDRTSRGKGVLSIDEASIDLGCSITPVLHWTKDRDGRREYSFDFPTDEEGKPIKTNNPLVGLLSIAYLCPDIVDGVNGVGGWPKDVGLPEEKAKSDEKATQVETKSSDNSTDRFPKKEPRKQFMGPAQVPVLAIMLRRSLLNSDFIKAVENFAEQKSR